VRRIRTGKGYDGAIDFDLARIESTGDVPGTIHSGDNLTQRGYQAMANAIDLSLFGVKAVLARR
jgi:hypothetical protein